MENIANEESVTGSDNNRGDNKEDREEESGQLGVDSGQVSKVRPQLEKKLTYQVGLVLIKPYGAYQLLARYPVAVNK